MEDIKKKFLFSYNQYGCVLNSINTSSGTNDDRNMKIGIFDEQVTGASRIVGFDVDYSLSPNNGVFDFDELMVNISNSFEVYLVDKLLDGPGQSNSKNKKSNFVLTSIEDQPGFNNGIYFEKKEDGSWKRVNRNFLK
ncbi:MAG: hypothetical protein HC932_05565 [Thermales bacterium]|nr:hypothetical protein [Thermales bacterium]